MAASNDLGALILFAAIKGKSSCLESLHTLKR